MVESVTIFESSAINGANSAVRREQSILRSALAHYSSGISAGKEPTGKASEKATAANTSETA